MLRELSQSSNLSRAQAPVQRVSRSRILVPREHGAWAVLLMPYFIALGVTGSLGTPALLFLCAALAAFSARYPLGLMLKPASSAEPASAAQSPPLWLAIWAGAALLSGGALMIGFDRWLLVPLALIAAAFFAVEQTLRRNRLERTVAGELLAFATLSLTGPAAYYSFTGRADATAFAIWALAFAYAGAGVFYVKLRVRQRVTRAGSLPLRARLALGRGLAVYLASAILALVALALAGVVPWLVLIAFAPLTYKALKNLLAVDPGLNLRRIGYLEVAHALAFTFLLLAAFAVSARL